MKNAAEDKIAHGLIDNIREEGAEEQQADIQEGIQVAKPGDGGVGGRDGRPGRQARGRGSGRLGRRRPAVKAILRNESHAAAEDSRGERDTQMSEDKHRGYYSMGVEIGVSRRGNGSWIKSRMTR